MEGKKTEMLEKHLNKLFNTHIIILINDTIIWRAGSMNDQVANMQDREGKRKEQLVHLVSISAKKKCIKSSVFFVELTVWFCSNEWMHKHLHSNSNINVFIPILNEAKCWKYFMHILSLYLLDVVYSVLLLMWWHTVCKCNICNWHILGVMVHHRIAEGLMPLPNNEELYPFQGLSILFASWT